VGSIDQTSERQADYASRATAVFATCRPRVIDSVLYEINNHMTTQNEEYEELRNLKFYHNVYR